MSLDASKIGNLHPGRDGAQIGRCPACAEKEGDNKGDHLIIYANERYGCVANQNDKEHSKRIHQLAGFPGSPIADGSKQRLRVRSRTHSRLDQAGKSRILRMVHFDSLAMQESKETWDKYTEDRHKHVSVVSDATARGSKETIQMTLQPPARATARGLSSDPAFRKAVYAKWKREDERRAADI